METRVGREKVEGLYQAWIKGAPLKQLIEVFGVSRQRIYQILKSYKKVGPREKMLRSVNKFSH